MLEIIGGAGAWCNSGSPSFSAAGLGGERSSPKPLICGVTLGLMLLTLLFDMYVRPLGRSLVSLGPGILHTGLGQNASGQLSRAVKFSPRAWRLLDLTGEEAESCGVWTSRCWRFPCRPCSVCAVGQSWLPSGPCRLVGRGGLCHSTCCLEKHPRRLTSPLPFPPSCEP